MRRTLAGSILLVPLALSCSEAPGAEGPNAGRRRGVVVTFDANARGASRDIDPRDRAWKPYSYTQLPPSRADGQPTFSMGDAWFKQVYAPVWRRVLGPFEGRPDLGYLEVGVYEGRATTWMFQNILTHPSSRAVGIDIFSHEGLEERFRENLERIGVLDRVETLVGYSNVKLRELEGEHFDIIYVDASHIASDVLRDAVLSWDLLKPGGILIFDDYRYTLHFPLELRPKRALDTFVTAFRDELDVLHRDFQLIVRKKRDPCPGYCSVLGPYHFYWNWKDVKGRGTLYDPRTEARVPLAEAELALVEEVLRSRPFASTQIVLRPERAESAEFAALREKLGL